MGKEYQLCRVCLCKIKSSISLNATCEKSPELMYIYIFNMCTQLDAAIDDALPQYLCISCSSNLIKAYDFLQSAQDSDCKLKELYKSGRKTRSSGSNLRLYCKNNQLSKTDLPQIYDTYKNSYEQNSEEVNAKVEFITCSRDPLEETDEEIEDLNITDKNLNDSKADIWSECESVNKISSDIEDEDDKPLGELIKSAKSLQMRNKKISNDDDSNNVLSNFDPNEDKCISPTESLPDFNASPEEQLFPQGRYKCKICEKPYFTTAGLKVHNTIHLPKQVKTKTKARIPNKRRNKITTVGEVISEDLKENLSKSNKIIVDESSENAGNVCVTKRKLPKPKKMFPCHVCGKHMISASKLRYHMVMHTGEKDYLCTICPKAYSTIYALKHHMRTHTGERPYECKFCGDKFTRPTTLKSHMRRHTGERPYGCDICGKRFIQHSSMTTHMKLNHMAKTIPCPHCDKKYARQTDLTTHLLSHTGDKPFSCQLCPSRFIRQANLNKHMNQHHTDKSVVSSASSKGTKKLQKLEKKMVLVEKFPVGGEAATVKCPAITTEDNLLDTIAYKQPSASIRIPEDNVAVSIGQPINTSVLPSIFSSNISSLIEHTSNRLVTTKTRTPTQVQTNSTNHIIGQATDIFESERLGRDIDDINRWSWPQSS